MTILSSARKTSCSESNSRRLSKGRYLAFNLVKPMIFVILEDMNVGKVGSATVFLRARCGSALMIHMFREEKSLRECGTAILLGFNRFLSTICCFVVRLSQIGCTSSASKSDTSSEAGRRLFLEESSCSRCVSSLTCLRRAVEAFRAWQWLAVVYKVNDARTDLVNIKMVWRLCIRVCTHCGRRL